MKKIRNILTLALSGLFLAGFLLAAILTPDRTDSLSERRKLAQRPALRASAVADGTYMTAFEKYSLDQFPLRDSFRALKAFSPGISCGSSIITAYMQPAGISQSSTIR